MRFIYLKSLFILSLALLLPACSTEESEALGSVTLEWTAPLAREDNTELELYEIAGYRVYYGKTSGNYSNQIEIIDSFADKATVTASRGSYYFVLTCFDTEGIESTYSEEFNINI